MVLDYLTPGMDGEETARRIRKLRSVIPIILSSGCLTLPERVLGVVTVAVEKAAGTEAVIEVLEQHLQPLIQKDWHYSPEMTGGVLGKMTQT